MKPEQTIISKLALCWICIITCMVFCFATMPSNAEVWQKCLGTSGNDFASSVQQTTDGGYIVAGYTFSSDGKVRGNHGGCDAWIVKLETSNERKECMINCMPDCLGDSGDFPPGHKPNVTGCNKNCNWACSDLPEYYPARTNWGEFDYPPIWQAEKPGCGLSGRFCCIGFLFVVVQVW